MNENQFKALMADNEKLLIWVGDGIQSNLNYLFTLTVSLSLTFLFIALKLEAVISWQWTWVLAPGWLLLPGTLAWGFYNHRGQVEGIKDLKIERAMLIEKIIKEND